MSSTSKTLLLVFICLLTLLDFGVRPVHSQPGTKTELHGIVTDAETGKPIPDVQVYLSGTTTGTVTNDEGRFEFSTELSGTHQIVFSFLGYRTLTGTINLYDQEQFTFEIAMEADLLQFDEVVVTATRDEEWQKQYEKFRDEFIGTSSFSEMTEIENPLIIEFSLDQENNLIATVPEPLVIVNNALGYRIHTDHLDFSWIRNGYSGSYNLIFRVEELEPDNEEQLNLWQQNRKTAYMGSLRHFLQSLYSETVKSGDFRITRAGRYSLEIDLIQVSKSELRLYMMESGRNPTTYTDIFKGFRLPPIANGTISVYYTPEDKLSQYSNLTVNQHSTLTVKSDRNQFFISESGELLNTRSLAVTGSWTHQRMAEFLPYDYRPTVQMDVDEADESSDSEAGTSDTIDSKTD